MAGFWRGSGGIDQPSEPDRPERVEQQPGCGRVYGDFDPAKISDEELLSYFGFDNWDDWRRAQEKPDDERLGDELLKSAGGMEQRLGTELSSGQGELEGLSPDGLTPPQSHDRADRPAQPEQSTDSADQAGDSTDDVESIGDRPGELAPTLVRSDEAQAKQADTPAEGDQEPERSRTWQTIAEAVGDVTVSELRAAAEEPDRNGLTRAGRALQKHSGREGSVFFGQSDGSADARNEKGLTVLDEILGDAGGRTEVLDRVINVWDSSGRGVRFGKDGSFMGFLEPMP